MGANRYWRGMEAQGRRRVVSFPEGTLEVVRRTRLYLGKRRAVGLAAVSLWALDAQKRNGLGLGTGRIGCFQTGRRVLAAGRETRRLGAAQSRRTMVTFRAAG